MTVLANGGVVTVPGPPVIQNGDALIRVYPIGHPSSTYYIGDFTTSSSSGFFTPSIPAGTSSAGDDCNGTPGALNVEVNGTCGIDCMLIW